MTSSVIGASVQGASHKQNKKPCQDSFAMKQLSATATLVAVADGHGSSSCSYSKYGAKIAVNVFCSVLSELYCQCKENIEALSFQFKKDGGVSISQRIDSEWKKRVLRAHRRSNRDPDKLENENEIYHQYGTTLLGVLVTDELLFAYQLGDGNITVVGEEMVFPALDVEKILGVETHSMSKMDAWKNTVLKVIGIDSLIRPVSIMLSTDGFSNSFINEDEFYKSCADYHKLINEHGMETIGKHLKKWLYETSNEGCGDDITLSIIHLS